jgi:large subunit ribosomal protein L6e
MNNNLRLKRKIWTNSVISCTNLAKFTLRDFSEYKNKKIVSKKFKKGSYGYIFGLSKLFNLDNTKGKEKKSRNLNLKIGSVIILLSSSFQGKKAILLKITKSGLFVVSGPYKINGIPLRRVNPRYTIPTRIEIDVTGINTAILNDEYFTVLKRSQKNQNNNFKNRIIMAHNLRQTYIDRCLQKKIDTDFFLGAYLKSNYVNTSF